MITINPLTGYIQNTTFTISSDESLIPYGIIDWGDSSLSSITASNTTHIYSEKGIYDVTVSNCDVLSSFSVSAFSPFYEDTIVVNVNSASVLTNCPATFYINVSSIHPNIDVNLYSRNSNSQPPIDNSSFWDHLNPRWTFFTENEDQISTITISGTPIYDNDNLLGYTGSSMVFYKDALPGTPDILFTIPQEDRLTKINSNVYASIPLTILPTIPTHLNITTDGLIPFSGFYWSDNNIPIVITVSDNTCSSIIHYASGYLVDINLVQGCNNLLDSSYNVPLLVENFDIPCIKNDHFRTSLLNIPSSAINSDLIQSTDIKCGVNPDEIKTERKRRNPTNIILTATGIFNVDGEIYTLSGQSTPFDVQKFEEFYKFFRKGEEQNIYNLLEQYNHFDLNELPQMQKYLQSIAGEGDTLGKMYDKIVNFDTDHADLDLCRIATIYDIAQKLDIDDVSDFNIDFPQDIERFLHLSSIPLNKLVGVRNTNSGKLGELLKSQDNLDIGEIVAYRKIGNDEIDLFESPQRSNISNLSSFPDYNNINDYCFYRWIPDEDVISDSIINYNDERNKLNSSLVTFQDWFSDYGIIDETFHYLLTKNLINN
jgi:hypothetical protein